MNISRRDLLGGLAGLVPGVALGAGATDYARDAEDEARTLEERIDWPSVDQYLHESSNDLLTSRTLDLAKKLHQKIQAQATEGGYADDLNDINSSGPLPGNVSPDLRVLNRDADTLKQTHQAYKALAKINYRTNFSGADWLTRAYFCLLKAMGEMSQSIEKLLPKFPKLAEAV